MLNLQRLYLILGNFCNAFAMQRLSTGTHTLKRFSFLFFKFLFYYFFSSKTSGYAENCYLFVHFALLWAPAVVWNLWFAYILLMRIDSVLKFGEKMVINHNILDNTACGFKICWWGTEGNWLYSKLRKHFNSIFKTVQKRKKGIARKIVLNFWETT